MLSNFFIDISCKQQNCKKERICGDTFLYRRSEDGERSIIVLSDGMGHGVKANVLSTLTASMVVNFDYHNDSILKMAEMIIKSLPICSVRKVSYSTFSIADINQTTGKATIIEYDNPQGIIIRNGEILNEPWLSTVITAVEGNRQQNIRTISFDIKEGDRIVLMSDGVTQSGQGSDKYPFGWGRVRVSNFVQNMVSDDRNISSEKLASGVVSRAVSNDGVFTNDDISCAVISVRKPKSVLLCSCPPSNKSFYDKLIRIIEGFEGKKIVCGYHLAMLISEINGNQIVRNEYSEDPDVQPLWSMEGVDLVTESLVTLNKVYDILEHNDDYYCEYGAAYEVYKVLMESDEINILMGMSRGNGGLYMVDEYELRRKVLGHIVRILQTKYRKEVNIKHI